MFAEYLKQKRKALNLTQSDLTAKLNLFSETFQSLDNVTVSRWERGTTTPSRHKMLLAVRFFKDDIIDFLLQQNVHSDFNDLKDFLILRYFSVISISNSIHHQTIITTQKKNLVPVKISSKHLTYIQNLHELLGVNDEKLFSIDLNAYVADNRAVSRIFIDDHGQFLAHNFNFYFHSNDFFQQAEAKKCTINYETSVNSKKNSDLVSYHCTRYFRNESSFLYNMYLDLLGLVKNDNIKYLAYRLVGRGTYEYYSKQGFSVLCCGSQNPLGEIQIGGKRYREVIMYTSVEKLLASDDMISFFQRYHRMCCDAERYQGSLVFKREMNKDEC